MFSVRRTVFTPLALFIAVSAAAQPAPTPDEFLGYKLGDRYTTHARILDYFNELAKKSNLITVQKFGETYEGRPLVTATITSAKNRANLEAIRRDVVSLSASADTVEAAKANDIAARAPVVVLLAFGVHGNESSSAEAAMQVASTLLRDPQYTALLDNAVVLIDPLQFVKQPRIALVGGPVTFASSYGALWHTLDIGTPIPHSNINFDSIGRIDLNHYGVIVLPDGNYRLGSKDVEKLRAWLRNGGTLVAVGGASSALRDKDVEISKVKAWEPPKKKDDDKTPVRDELYNEPRVPGAAFRTTMNERSYLTFGVPRPPAVLIEGTTALLPVSHKVDNIVTIASTDPLVSGVAFPASIDRLKGAAFVVSEPYGRGNVITFAEEPHYRLFWRATLPIFLNAVIYSPSFPR